MNKIDLRKIDLNLLLILDVLMQEGSVSKAADRLGRTQSAMSHALGRLREQLGDPLLVKTHGRMKASPYALELVQEVRPILRSMERVLSPRQPFDAATSTRRFALAVPDLALNWFPHLVKRLRAQAPGIQIDWQAPKSSTLLDVAEGLVDLALLPAALPRPEGVAWAPVGDFHWTCFMRQGHPASARWNVKQWAAWPHVSVGTGDRLRSPVSEAAERAGIARQSGVSVPNFGAVAPLLGHSDLVATLPTIVLADAVAQFGLTLRPVPLRIPAMPHVVVWSARLHNDPASTWLRNAFTTVFQERLAAADALLHSHKNASTARRAKTTAHRATPRA